MKLTVIVSVFIAVLGVIISCLLAHITAKKEIEKTFLKLSHEDKKDAFNAFSKLQQTVRIFCSCPTGLYKKEALKAVGLYIAYSDDITRPLCETLTKVLNAEDTKTAEDIVNRLSVFWNDNKPTI